jgi:hypothetical protein
MHSNCPVCFEFLFDSVRPDTRWLLGILLLRADASFA